MGEERITLSQGELKRYSVIMEVIGGKLTNLEAAKLFGFCKRQVIRIKNKVREDGIKGVIHGNKGRSPANSLKKEIKDKIINLYNTRYTGFNCSHFTEFLIEKHSIRVSRETVRTLLLGAGLRIKSRKHPKHRLRRERMPQEGLLVQMDTSEHKWFGKEQPEAFLISVIDDATNEVPFALFADSDSVKNNMRVIKELINKKGVPAAFYVDRASHFKTTRHSSYRVNLKEEQNDTQIERALKELGITLIPAYSPQAKGRIERLFRTFQDRLINEMKLAKISNIKKANEFFINSFLPKHNAAFTVIPKEPQSAYRQVPDDVNLDSVFSIKDERTVMADNTISYKNRIFQILQDKIRRSYAKARVTVELRLDSSVHIKYKHYYLNAKELEQKKSNRKKQGVTLSLCKRSDIIALY
jgi:transposase